MARRKNKKFISLIIVLILLAVAVWQTLDKTNILNLGATSSVPTPVTSDGKIIAEFLDVDQADCELITLPDGKLLLIDAGNRGDGDELVDYFKGRGIDGFDYVIATHPHADHIGGMCDIVDNFEIGKIVAPKIAAEDIPTSQTYKDFLTSVQKKSLKITAAKAGTTLFEGEDYKIECFAPCSTDYESINDYSVVVKITYGIHSFLFTGDAETLSETEMLDKGYPLDSDVLKVGHHGSDTSSSAEFLKAVSPEYAVISCGTDNSYGHPHDVTLKALSNLSGLKRTFRTDLDKTIIITADGKSDKGLTFTLNNPTVIE